MDCEEEFNININNYFVPKKSYIELITESKLTSMFKYWQEVVDFDIAYLELAIKKVIHECTHTDTYGEHHKSNSNKMRKYESKLKELQYIKEKFLNDDMIKFYS